MSSTQDPLDTLRQAIRSKSKISYSNDAGPCASLANATHIVFSPSVSILKSTPTRLRKPGTTSSDPQTSPGDFIQLDAVFLAWALREAPGADYTRQVRENGVRVGFVSVTERKGLADWLEGRTNNYNRIAPLACKFFDTLGRAYFISITDSGLDNAAWNTSFTTCRPT